jgi:hypothetical protein
LLPFLRSLRSALRSNLLEIKRVAANAEQVKKFEAGIAPYVKKAREALPEAKKR